MGRKIKRLAGGAISSRTIFDKRIVVERCEAAHIHYRNMRLEFNADTWNEFLTAMRGAIGSDLPVPGKHVTIGRGSILSIRFPERCEVNLNRNLYKSFHTTGAAFYEEGTKVDIKIRDLRIEMGQEEFLVVADIITAAAMKLRAQDA